MKRINLVDYHSSMGKLIDVQHPEDYKKNPLSDTNIYADKLLMNYKTLLNPKESYYIICNKGMLSKKVVSILEFYGYNVTQVVH